MNIKVIKDSAIPNLSAMTGGGYAIQDAEVRIDANLDEHLQVELLFHEILELYMPLFPHDKIDELAESLCDGLDQLKEGN